MNRVFLLILLLLVAGANRQVIAQDNGTTLTLDQAIQIALRNNRDAKNARLEIDKANDKLDACRTQHQNLFPSLPKESRTS
jgi:outer membrane protein TolC